MKDAMPSTHEREEHAKKEQPRYMYVLRSVYEDLEGTVRSTYARNAAAVPQLDPHIDR